MFSKSYRVPTRAPDNEPQAPRLVHVASSLVSRFRFACATDTLISPLLTPRSLGGRLPSLAAKLVRPFARQSPPSSAAAESQYLMSSDPFLDWEYLQKVLASAFAVQESHIDSQSLYAAVKIGRLVKSGELDVNEAMHLIVDRVDRAPKVDNTTESAMDPFCAALPEFEEHDQSSAASGAPPKDELPSAADILEECFPSFRAVTPEVKTGQFRLRGWWTLLLVIEAIALAFLLSWMLGRVVSLRTAHPYGPPLHVTAKSYAAPAQPDEARQPDPSPSPLVPPKSRSPETPSGSLVVYQDGRVIFRLKSPQASGELSGPESVLGSPRKTNVRVLQQVEPDYPEAAKQQQIQGSVVLEAQVGKDGSVQHLTVISGNSMLATAASDAVLKWRFKPIVQDGRALPFQTQVKVHFVFR